MSKPASLKLTAAVEHWPLKAPFHITGYTFVTADVVVVTVERNGLTGRGEASGVYYLSDDAPHMLTQIEKVRDLIEGGAIGKHCKLCCRPVVLAMRSTARCGNWKQKAPASPFGNSRGSMRLSRCSPLTQSARAPQPLWPPARGPLRLLARSN